MNNEVTKEQGFRWQMPRAASGPEKPGLVTLFLCCSIHWAGMMHNEVTKEQSIGLEMARSAGGQEKTWLSYFVSLLFNPLCRNDEQRSNEGTKFWTGIATSV